MISRGQVQAVNQDALDNQRHGDKRWRCRLRMYRLSERPGTGDTAWPDHGIIPAHDAREALNPVHSLRVRREAF